MWGGGLAAGDLIPGQQQLTGCFGLLWNNVWPLHDFCILEKGHRRVIKLHGSFGMV